MKESLKVKNKAEKKATNKKTRTATSEKEYEEMLMQMIKDEFGIED